jgi:hypothetical protein
MEFSLILWGALGGLLPDIIRFIKNRFSGEFKGFYRSAAYWIGLLLLSCLGGLVVFLLKPEEIIYALGMGYCAPNLLTSILSKQIPVSSTQGFKEQQSLRKINLRHWWSV